MSSRPQNCRTERGRAGREHDALEQIALPRYWVADLLESQLSAEQPPISLSILPRMMGM
jgi:hypothetical protein